MSVKNYKVNVAGDCVTGTTRITGMGWSTGRTPPIVLSTDCLSARITGADVIAADVVLVEGICRNGPHGLCGREEYTGPCIREPIAGKAILRNSGFWPLRSAAVFPKLVNANP